MWELCVQRAGHRAARSSLPLVPVQGNNALPSATDPCLAAELCLQSPQETCHSLP